MINIFMSKNKNMHKNRKILRQYGWNFCAAPFMSLYEGEGGTITTCCKSRYEIGNTSKDSYEEVVNSDHMKKIRLQILNGEKPEQCRNCWSYEKETNTIAGAREWNNIMAYESGNLDRVIKFMKPDGTLKKQMPAWIDLLSTNKCNFSCMGCKPNLSSTIAKTYNEEFQILHDAKNSDYSDWTEEWTNENRPRIDYILKYKDTIKQIHLNGGEPFLSAETYELLDAMIDAGLNETITLWSHTNGSILKNYKGKDLIKDYFAKWKRVRLTISNDGFGIVGGYIRYGYTDEKWREVFLKAAEYPNIEIAAGGCLNIFNIFHLEEWGQNLIQIGKDAGIKNTEFVDLKAWGDRTVNINMIGVCKDTKQKAIKYIDDLLQRHKKSKDVLPDGWLRRLPAMRDAIANAKMPEKNYIRGFVNGIDALDKKRKIKFADACPELIPLYEKAKTLI
jgi:hypothetical protein